MKKIMAVALALVITVSMVPPVHAASYVSKSTIWSWLAAQFPDGIIPMLLGTTLPSLSGVCAESDDARHHSTGYLQDLGNGEYRTICQDCGHYVTVRAVDLPDVYDSYSSSLPVPEINNSNQLVWYPLAGIDRNIKFKYGSYLIEFHMYEKDGVVNVDVPGSFERFWAGGHDAFYFSIMDIYLPVTGYYICTGRAQKVSYSYYLSGKYVSKTTGDITILYDNHNNFDGGAGQHWRFKQTFSEGQEEIYTIDFSTNNSNIFCYLHPSDDGTVSDYHLQYNSPFYYIQPKDASAYTSDTRTGSMQNTGTLAVQTGDGNLTVLGEDSIFNETTNNFYSPQNQTNYNVSSWTYDYTTRTYHLTLDNGDTVNVTYGDENITVNEGDTTYNVYYVVQGTEPAPTPAPTPEPTPTPSPTPTPGEPTPTPTPGEVQTPETPPTVSPTPTPDPGGTATPEQPPGGGGDEGGGIGDAIEELFKFLLELLTSLLDGAVKLITSLIVDLGDMLKQLLEFFSGFTAFLAAAFPFLPEPVMVAISSGIIIMIILAIIKFIRG